MPDPATAAAAAGTMAPAGDDAPASAWPNGGPRFGDMVWGKVKSHPWWPGHVYSVALTDNAEVRRGGHRDGLTLVAFFGDSSYGWFEPHELVPFAEHFAEKVAQGGARTTAFAAAVAEAVDEVARRAALGVLCPCRNPAAFRTHPFHAGYLLVDVPGFDAGADYHPDQVTAARDRFVPGKALDFLLDAAVVQQGAAEAAARTVPGIEMAGLFAAYRRAVFAPRDDTYAEAFGVHPDKVRAAEEKAAAERAQRARPLTGKRKTPTEEAVPAPAPGRRRGGMAARLMEKIVPSASAMKVKAAKKDRYLLKRRDQPPEPSHRPAPLPDAQEDGPPGFGADPPTPPMPGSSTAEDEEFMMQRRAPPVVDPPPAVQATEGAATDAGASKKATKTKKARKREREQAADLSAPADADAGEPKKKKKKKRLSDIDGGAASAAGSGKLAASTSVKLLGDLHGLDLKQVTSDLQNLPLAPFHAAKHGLSDTARAFVLAFRSKYYKKSNENDSPEESKKTLSLVDNKPSAAPDGQQPPKKKKPAVRPGAGGDPVKAGVKRGASDRQEEMSVKKKAKLAKIKTLSKEKKTGGLEQKVTAAAAGAAARPATKDKAATTSGRKIKKEPAPAPRMRTPSPTALMMKFPVNSTLPSVASLKARFARFGALDVDGIRVYWKSSMCRVIYRFRSDAETALKYARSNAMFGPLDTQYHIKEVERSGGGEPPAPAADAPPMRLMETAPFRPGASGTSSPLPMSRAPMPARTVAAAAGQQPKSILKKSGDEGGSAVREVVPRVKFLLDAGDNKMEPYSPLPVGGGGNALDSRGAKPAVGSFAPQPARTLQPPMRAPAQQQVPSPRTQQLPPPPLPYQQAGQLPYYPPRNSDVPLALSSSHQTSQQQQQLPYPPRHNDDGMSSVLPPEQPPLPYPPPSFPGRHHQQQQQQAPPDDDIPEWKVSKEAFKDEVWKVMTGIAKLVEPLTDKNGFFPYHLFGGK